MAGEKGEGSDLLEGCGDGVGNPLNVAAEQPSKKKMGSDHNKKYKRKK